MKFIREEVFYYLINFNAQFLPKNKRIFYKEICHTSKAQGPCTDFQLRWFYDADLHQCREFHYGNCLGNQNNFGTLFECANFCWDFLSDEARQKAMNNTTESTNSSTSTNRVHIEKTVQPSQPKSYDTCDLKRDEGNSYCNNYTTRYFYDEASNDCQAFTYRGKIILRFIFIFSLYSRLY